MKRRDAILGILALGAVLDPAAAQLRARPARVATLQAGSPEGIGYLTDAFKKTMRDLGYVEGKTVVFDSRWAMGDADRLPGLAKEIVLLGPDVIVVGNIAATRAARQATATIPIVMATSVDPVGTGLIASLARPGGNITGLSNMAIDLGPKLLEMLLALEPRPSRVAVLLNPANPGHSTLLEAVQAQARKGGVRILQVKARSAQEIEDGFSVMTRENAAAVMVALDALFNQHTRRIVELARTRRLPSIAGWPQYAEAGGLMSYGQDLVENFRRAADYVDRILKGRRPAELPVEQPMKVELIINLKTAKALGIAVPRSMLLRADRVME